jgi:hypothetical protein
MAAPPIKTNLTFASNKARIVSSRFTFSTGNARRLGAAIAGLSLRRTASLLFRWVLAEVTPARRPSDQSQRAFLLIRGHSYATGKSSHSGKGASIVRVLLAQRIARRLSLEFTLNFHCGHRPSTLDLYCLGRGAEAMSSRAGSSEQLRMPVQKGLFFRPARSEEAFYCPPKSPR